MCLRATVRLEAASRAAIGPPFGFILVVALPFAILPLATSFSSRVRWLASRGASSSLKNARSMYCSRYTPPVPAYKAA